ncbi:hypothetical protein TNCV_4118911 [Trichonephila clavipes]|nr:hypothetical protein TNCV_4118911 [Trichonephila clavipes]
MGSYGRSVPFKVRKHRRPFQLLIILRLEVLVHQRSSVWACIIIREDEICSIHSAEKSDIECKDLIPGTSDLSENLFETQEGSMFACRDACPFRLDSSNIINSLFDNARKPISTLGLYSSFNEQMRHFYINSITAPLPYNFTGHCVSEGFAKSSAII